MDSLPSNPDDITIQSSIYDCSHGNNGFKLGHMPYILFSNVSIHKVHFPKGMKIAPALSLQGVIGANDTDTPKAVPTENHGENLKSISSEVGASTEDKDLNPSSYDVSTSNSKPSDGRETQMLLYIAVQKDVSHQQAHNWGDRVQI